MREILFRGKREDNGEWIEGYLVRRPSAIQVGEHCSPWAIDRPPNDPDDSGEVRFVDGETVGQFTGLADKNGRGIWEGDIIKDCDYGHIHSVRYFGDEGYPAFDCFPEIQFCECNGLSHLSAVSAMEVIGNIYDNPELLGVTP